MDKDIGYMYVSVDWNFDQSNPIVTHCPLAVVFGFVLPMFFIYIIHRLQPWIFSLVVVF